MKTILLVDDSSIVRKSVGAAIDTSKFKLEAAVDGTDALKQLQGGLKPDVIITDLNMPNMGGLEFVQEARKLPGTRFTPIFVLTTEQQQAKKDAAKAAGATGWFVKPLNWEKLYEALKQAVPGC